MSLRFEGPRRYSRRYRDNFQRLLIFPTECRRPPAQRLLPPTALTPCRSLKRAFWALTFGSIGVVYGDIGTSPLYAFREAVLAAGGECGPGHASAAIYGVLSLIFWSLIFVVTLKYVLILLRADNNGEGGTLALTALAFRALGRRTPFVLALGIVGASMFYGSTLITPALSVLSAVEGLNVATARVPALRAAADRRDPGGAVLGAVARHGARLGLLRADHLRLVPRHRRRRRPSRSWPIRAVLARDQSRVYGVGFLFSHGIIGLRHARLRCSSSSPARRRSTTISAISADGRSRPHGSSSCCRRCCSIISAKARCCSRTRETIENPFYLLYPDWALYPMVALATAATAIASQAVITGAYSITRQAMQLGFMPRMEVRHTSEALAGQIYMPRVNWLLLTGVLLLVFMFRSSSELAAAYVLAVATTAWAAGILGFIVIWKLWKWPLWAAAGA